MNSTEHKREAERLIEATQSQMVQMERLCELGANYNLINSAVEIIKATAAVAQVHATLATLLDPITYDSFTSAP